MNLKKKYQELYKRWLNELNSEYIIKLKDEEYAEINDLLFNMKKVSITGKENLETHLISEYQNNISYMLNDLISIRKEKIINSALNLKEINLDNLFEAEKLFYQNLVVAIKGFNKMQNLFGSSLIKESLIQPNGEEKPEIASISNGEIKNKIVSKVQEDLKEEFDYTLVRILKETPAIVGFDLNTYGPFKKEDVINMPQKNAKILVNEKFAEFFEIS